MATYLLILLSFLRRLSKKVLHTCAVPGLTFSHGKHHWLGIRIYWKDGKEEYWPCIISFGLPGKPPTKGSLEQNLTKLRKSRLDQLFYTDVAKRIRKVEFSIIPTPDDPWMVSGCVRFKMKYGICTHGKIRAAMYGS